MYFPFNSKYGDSKTNVNHIEYNIVLLFITSYTQIWIIVETNFDYGDMTKYRNKHVHHVKLV